MAPEVVEDEVLVSTVAQIRYIRFNNPKKLNPVTSGQMTGLTKALRDANDDPNIVFTVITNEGRFFNSGADVTAAHRDSPPPSGDSHYQIKKNYYASQDAGPVETMRLILEHKKILIVAMNGGAVGAGTWYPAAADLCYVSDTSYLLIPFSGVGTVAENGIAMMFGQAAGFRRPLEMLLFGTKVSAQELHSWGIANRIFPAASFHADLQAFLLQQLEENDHWSILQTKKLAMEPMKDQRMLAAYRAMEAHSESLASGNLQAGIVRRAKYLEERNRKKKEEQSKGKL